MPHLENCPHDSDGWCLDCVKQMHDRIETLEFTANMLYSITGDQRKTIRYLLDRLGLGDGQVKEMQGRHQALDEATEQAQDLDMGY